MVICMIGSCCALLLHIIHVSAVSRQLANSLDYYTWEIIWGFPEYLDVACVSFTRPQWVNHDFWRCDFCQHIDGLVHERSNSNALALELHLSCSNPSIWGIKSGLDLQVDVCHCNPLCYPSVHYPRYLNRLIFLFSYVYNQWCTGLVPETVATSLLFFEVSFLLNQMM